MNHNVGWDLVCLTGCLAFEHGLIIFCIGIWHIFVALGNGGLPVSVWSKVVDKLILMPSLQQVYLHLSMVTCLFAGSLSFALKWCLTLHEFGGELVGMSAQVWAHNYSGHGLLYTVRVMHFDLARNVMKKLKEMRISNSVQCRAPAHTDNWMCRAPSLQIFWNRLLVHFCGSSIVKFSLPRKLGGSGTCVEELGSKVQKILDQV